MPATKNTGLQTLNELFAMKKNMAFQANFDHTMTSMIKDYYHKRDNFNQEMKKVYNDMRDIRISTGYSLDQTRSENENGPYRNPNPPTVYFPPIGLRLVRKYAGLDLKTGTTPDKGGNKSSKSGDASLPSLIAPDVVMSTIRRMSKATGIDLSVKRRMKTKRSPKHVVFDETMRGNTEKPDIVITPIIEDEDSLLRKVTDASNISEGGALIPDYFLGSNLVDIGNSFGTTEFPISTEVQSFNDTPGITVNEAEELDDGMSNDYGDEQATDIDDSEDPDQVFLNATYNLKDRRSSRSTFRTRTTVRMVSLPSLSEHNMGVINMSSGKSKSRSGTASTKSKAEVDHFWLDYGDGKLHDNMKIPKIKDCARPWCNPHCQTCQRRTKQGPCFILIPKSDNDVRKRQVPTDKRRLSMFPIYRGNSDLSNTSSVDAEDRGDPNSGHDTPKDEKSNSKFADYVDDEDVANIDTESIGDSSNVHCKKTQNKDIETLLKERIKTRPKGYNKNRIDELAQPRGVPPAEVRFSKTSLRRKQEQLKEGERNKAMELEKRNQTIIQGKISMFLALLNEKENTMKPRKMVDLPIREDVKSKLRRKVSRKRLGRFRSHVKYDLRLRE